MRDGGHPDSCRPGYRGSQRADQSAVPELSNRMGPRYWRPERKFLKLNSARIDVPRIIEITMRPAPNDIGQHRQGSEA